MVKVDENEILTPVRTIVIMLALTVGLLTILIIFLAFRFSRLISDPIHKLHKGTEIIGSGDLDYKVGTPVKDEIGQLSRAFDQMTENLKKTLSSRAEFKAISDAALGRELKMMELEKEVSGLLKELGREPKYK